MGATPAPRAIRNAGTARLPICANSKRKRRCRPRAYKTMTIGEAFFNTAAVVAIGEMGDKTQVLALLLAARYRKPWPVAGGVLLATLIAMTATAWLGAFASQLLPPQVLRWVLVAMFF